MCVIAGGDPSRICVPQRSSGLCQAVSNPWSQHFHIKEVSPMSLLQQKPLPPRPFPNSPQLLTLSPTAFTPSSLVTHSTASILTSAVDPFKFATGWNNHCCCQYALPCNDSPVGFQPVPLMRNTSAILCHLPREMLLQQCESDLTGACVMYLYLSAVHS